MKKNNMKVLFLVNIPSPYRVDFFNHLGKFCDLTVLFERKSSAERDASWANANFINFNGIFLNSLNIRKNTALSIEILKYIKKNKYNIIVIGGYATPTGMLAIELLKMKKIPFILNTDGGIIKKDSIVKYNIKKRFISSAAQWLSTGSKTTEYLLHYGADFEQVYTYSFTSLKQNELIERPPLKNKKIQLRKKLGIHEEKVILSIGQFIDRKGFDILLAACGKISKDYGVYIIGGKVTKEYKEIINDLNLKNVHFLEFKTKSILKDYYEMSDLFVLPTREDIWGLVINEAMSAGLPVITTDKCVAGLELIENNINGFVIPVNNAKELAIKIELILSNPKKLDEMSVNNVEKIKKYTVENMAEEHIEIFKKFLSI